MTRLLCVYLLLVNVAAFFAYALDKWKAKHQRWRIPEATLLGLSLAGGFVGAGLGMVLCHHKTRKWKFRLGVPASAAVWLIGAVLLFKLR